MIQDAAACGLATGPIAGLPNDGTVTARSPAVPRDSRTAHAPGTWYRFETQNYPFETYRAEPIEIKHGFTARLCWCPLAAGCDSSKPEGFRIDAGIITIIRFSRISENRCEVSKPCLVAMQIEPY